MYLFILSILLNIYDIKYNKNHKKKYKHKIYI